MSAQVLTLKLPAPLVIEAVPLAEQLPVGRLIEIARTAGGAQMTMAVACVRKAQEQGEPVAWVQRAGGALFPPDLADSGVDFAGLLVVHVPRSAAGKDARASRPAVRGVAAPAPPQHDLAKAAELLLRSGAFGLVVIDLTAVPAGGIEVEAPPCAQTLELAVQSRLLGLAREHKCSVLLLSERGSRGGSLGPLVSMCIEPQRRRVGRGEFSIEPRARKDKSGLLCALAAEQRRGPWGLL